VQERQDITAVLPGLLVSDTAEHRHRVPDVPQGSATPASMR